MALENRNDKTYYAPAGRKSLAQLLEERDGLENFLTVKDLLDSLSSILVVLNKERQIIYSNEVLLNQLGIGSADEIFGARIGEAFSCIHSAKGPDGCGTSENCRYCGAVNTILKCQRNLERVTDECRIMGVKDGVNFYLDLEITVTPISDRKENLLIVSIIDISDKKRRIVLERIFFHDIINIAGGLSSLLELVEALPDKEEQRELLKHATLLGRRVLDEINAQRMLGMAENNELRVDKVKIESIKFLEDVVAQIQYNNIASGKVIKIDSSSVDTSFKSDKMLLNRVLINMIKNALEASKKDETIILLCEERDRRLRFSVKNNEVMPISVQLQMFQRSFSTKAIDRGIGTYSMKLIGENYLGGKVGFESEEGKGTIFYIVLPEDAMSE